MIKFKNIQIKIKLFYLKISGKIKKVNNPIEIAQNNKKSMNNILIIFPIKESAFRVALYSFRSLLKNKNVNYYYLINNIYKHHFRLSGHVFNLYYNKEKIKIDETFYDERIINKNFDMVIDLNNEFIYDICCMVNNIHSYYKVGFKSEYSDYFYNVQFNLSTTDVLENSYKKIHLMLN